MSSRLNILIFREIPASYLLLTTGRHVFHTFLRSAYTDATLVTTF